MAGLYEKDTDYQALINAAVEAGNMKGAAKYEQQRNAKIAGEGITNHGQTSNYTDYLHYTPGIDYSKKAGDLYAAGETTGAWNTLFGNTDSREAKISGIGTDHGKTSQSIWDELVANASSDNMMQQIQNTIAQIQNQDYSYGGSKWDNTLDQLAQASIDFNYDDWANSDQYKALADRYGYQGKLTMQDVLGQISSRTGGLASSYATTAAQQQYNDYMAQMENAARSQYADEKNSMLDNATLAQNMSESEYQRYLNEQSAKTSGQSEALTALYNLLGYQTDAENTEYSQGQDSRTDAQNRVYDYLVNQGGAVADLGADLITASGYTTAELNAMAAKYAQGMTAAAAKSSGSSSSGGSSGGSASKASSKPTLTAAQTLAAINDGIVNDATKAAYEYYYGQPYAGDDADDGDAQEASISNRHGDSWAYIPGHGRFSYDEIENYVSSGKVIETYDKSTNSYSYRWYTNKQE